MLFLSINLPQHLLKFPFNYLKNIYAKAPHYRPSIFIGDFSVNMLENTFIIKTITRLYATSVFFNFSKKHNNLQITI